MVSRPVPAPDRPSTRRHRIPRRRLVRRAAWLSATAYLALALGVLGSYGPTWDCVFGDYRWGEANWHGALHGLDPVAIYDGEVADPQIRRGPHPEFLANFIAAKLFSLAATASAASADLLWHRTGLLDPVRAHHLPLPVLVAALLSVLVLFHARGRKLLWALLPAALLCTSPRFFANAQNNLKDVPEACLFSLAALSFFAAQRRPTASRWLLAGALTACALAQKQNGLLLGPLFGSTAIALHYSGDRVLTSPRFWLGGLVGSLAALVTYAAVSPWLWHDPARLIEHIRLTLDIGVRGDDIDLHGITRVAITTPIPLLVFAPLGIVVGRLGRRRRLFLTLWLTVVLGRLLVPGMRNFNGVRHFLEFYPPLVLFAAAGVERFASCVGSLLPRARRTVGCLVVTGALLPGWVATTTTHPNGVCWFNAFVGGLPGARARQLEDADDYWANSYWQAIGWLNEHAARDAEVFVPTMRVILAASAPVRLREDLRLSPYDTRFRFAKGDHGIAGEGTPPGSPSYVVALHGTKYSDTFLRAAAQRNLEPAHTISVQGTDVLAIFEARSEGQVALVRRAWLAVTQNADHDLFRAWAVLAAPGEVTAVQTLLQQVRALGQDEVTERIRAIMPRNTHAMVERMVETARGTND